MHIKSDWFAVFPWLKLEQNGTVCRQNNDQNIFAVGKPAINPKDDLKKNAKSCSHMNASKSIVFRQDFKKAKLNYYTVLSTCRQRTL